MKINQKTAKALSYSILLIVSIGCGTKPLESSVHSDEITQSKHEVPRNKIPRYVLMDSISSADPVSRISLVDQYVTNPEFDDFGKCGIVEKYGNELQKKRHLSKLIESINWRADGIAPIEVAEIRPFIDVKQVSVKVRTDIIHGLEVHTNAQIKGTYEEFNKMSTRQLFDLCDVDACIFRSKYEPAIEKASKMLEADPQNELIIEIYLVAVSRGHGWIEAAKYGELKSRVHNAERRSRLEREVDAPSRIIWHTAHGDHVNKF